MQFFNSFLDTMKDCKKETSKINSEINVYSSLSSLYPKCIMNMNNRDYVDVAKNADYISRDKFVIQKRLNT